jgi:predicted  nucleic acid-binding Zn-ribbon protein
MKKNETELRTAINWTEEKIKEVDKSTEENDSIKSEIERIELRIAEVRRKITTVRGNLSWQNNRSQQASTIIKRGY